MYINFFKLILDYTVAVIILVVTSPIFILLILLLKIVNGDSGVFFLQQRVGRNNKLFKIIKFKTMRDDRDKSGILLQDNLRITSLGKFIRSFSIDEIPQLFNILKGDMSFIGPRPLLEKYLPLYSEEQSKRHMLKSGITGWAQVNGRNNISWTKKFELDVWYTENASFFLDVKIIFLTLIKVLSRSDINSENPQTFSPFNGKN
tara:strand:- start:107 stop:715 length:609 start_codon:yes stop_codon:yes gene_type:complete